MKSKPRRVADLEEREEIVYSFMDDLRKWTIQLQGERKEHKLRLRELEIGNAETRDMIRAVNVLHADSQKRIAQNEVELIELRKLQQVMHERVSLLENRQNGAHK
ncbi:MAG TPA: hypothetical protein VFX22_04080 [Candidatus Kapabacteria bacterium]|nr:hypothetical protein [Candidatus Kapabacteria bacterium]